MSTPLRVFKDPAEALDVAIDFAARLFPGERLTTVESATAVLIATGNPASVLGEVRILSEPVTWPVGGVSATRALVRVQDGDDEGQYRITVRVATSAGQELEESFELWVQDL